MITIDDLKTNAKFRGLMFLDMAHGAYENHYQSQTYPRLLVIKAGAPHSKKVKQIHSTTYFVDGIECPNLDDVINALNAEPPEKPKRIRRIKCDECGQNWVEEKGEICPGCEAYREHMGHF